MWRFRPGELTTQGRAGDGIRVAAWRVRISSVTPSEEASRRCSCSSVPSESGGSSSPRRAVSARRWVVAAARVPAGCSRAHSRAACATHQLARPDQDVRSSVVPSPLKRVARGPGGASTRLVRRHRSQPDKVIAGHITRQGSRQMRVGAVCFRSICPRRICSRCLRSRTSGRPLRPANDLVTGDGSGGIAAKMGHDVAMPPATARSSTSREAHASSPHPRNTQDAEIVPLVSWRLTPPDVSRISCAARLDRERGKSPSRPRLSCGPPCARCVLRRRSWPGLGTRSRHLGSSRPGPR
jgi:hypothetical protein